MRYITFLFVSIGALFYFGCEDLDNIKNVSFKNDILPILRENCIDCHSSELSSGNLNFENYASLMNSRYFNRNTPVAIAGDSEESRLYLVVHSDKQAIRMPPPSSGRDKLNNYEIKKIKVWIDEGANNN